MRYISLTEAKHHLNIEDGNTTDDTYIVSLVDAAELAVEHYLQRPLSGIAHDGRLPADVAHAIKLVLGTLYANRESVTYGTPSVVPMAIGLLLTPWISYAGGIAK